MLFDKKRNISIESRASAALANLQRDVTAMNAQRSILESRINSVLNGKGNTEGYPELAYMLELIRNGEMMLNLLSASAESAAYLREFVRIIENAASSIVDIKNDLEQMMPAAEASISMIHNAIIKTHTELLPELKQEIGRPSISPILIGAIRSNRNTANVDNKEETPSSMVLKEEGKQGQAERMLA